MSQKILKKKPVSYKSHLKQIIPKKSKPYTAGTNPKSLRPVFLRQPSVKDSHRRLQTAEEAKKQNITPPYVIKLREEYLKKGKLTNAHKKFLNLVGNNRVVKSGCPGCGNSIKNMSL